MDIVEQLVAMLELLIYGWSCRKLHHPHVQPCMPSQFVTALHACLCEVGGLLCYCWVVIQTMT